MDPEMADLPAAPLAPIPAWASAYSFDGSHAGDQSVLELKIEGETWRIVRPRDCSPSELQLLVDLEDVCDLLFTPEQEDLVLRTWRATRFWH